jgi:hypothetical protein
MTIARAFLVLLPLFAVVAAAAPDARPEPPPSHPRGYVCYRAPSPITIDGKLDDPAWAAAPWTADFVDIEGDAKPKPRFRTRVKMLWDDSALYIAAELEEPHIWATLTEHDSVIFNDPDFEVFLDPDGDNHLYAELELNAKNTTWDLLLTKPYRDKGKPINAWEIAGLKTAVHVAGTLNDPRDTDTGWTVEIKWPWAGLKELTEVPVPPADGDQWRINFSRVEWDTVVVGGTYAKVKDRLEHNWVWSSQGAIDMHRPEMWGYLQFSTGEPGKVAFRPDPAYPVMERLHRVYYAQRAYKKANGRFAGALAELKLTDVERVAMEATRTQFEACAAGTGGKRWRIRDDSHLTAEQE